MTDHIPKGLSDYPLISDWIRFENDGRVTVLSGRVELGQGASTAIAQMAAHELFVSRVQVDLVSGDTQRVPNEGYTVGSYSVSQGGVSVQMAAAAARQVVIDYASELLQVPSSEININGGQIYRAGIQTELDYWNLPEPPDLDREILLHTESSPSNENSLIGKPAPANDLLSRLNGTAFIHDLHMPGLLHARMVLPEQPGRAFSIDESLAADINSGGSTIIRKQNFIAVVDRREERAVANAERLQRRSQTATVASGYGDDMIDALAQLQTTQTIEFEQHTANEPATQTVSVSIARPCIAHASIGPSCAVAKLDGQQLTVWTHSQGVFHLRSALAGVLDIDEQDIRVIHMPGAGCYGHNGADDVACDAAIVATAMPGSPIRILYNRADEFSKTTVGPAMRTDAVASLGADNKIVSLDMHITSPPHSCRPRSDAIPNLRSAALLCDPSDDQPQYDYRDVPLSGGGGADRNAVPAYSIPHITVVKNSLTPPYRGSSLRSLGAYVNVLAIESVMDECAIELNVDPVQLRLAQLDDPRAVEVINRVVKTASYDVAKPGFGFGYARYTNRAAYCACVARVSVDEQVSVENLWLCVDAGQAVNPDGVKAQFEGGAIQALSWLLCEEVMFADGVISTRSWEDYPIIAFNALPAISVEVVDRHSAPLGCGEAASGPVAAAVLNAVRSELGIRPTRTPLTRERLITAIENANQ